MAFLPNEIVVRLANLLGAILFLAGSLVTAAVAAGLLSSYTVNPIVLSTIPLLVGALAMSVAGLVLHPTATFSSLGLRPLDARDALSGGVVGAAGCALLAGAVVICGMAEFTPLDGTGIRFDWREARMAGVSLLAVGSAGEELFLRGLAFQLLACAARPLGAVALTSIAFALLHGANPGVTPLAQVNTALFGAVFGLAVVRHRSLWMAFGLHLGWNLAQVLLGANTSGITIRLTGLNLELHGQDWLTGGDYGLEGGLLASGTALLLVAVVWWLPRKSGRPATLWDPVRSQVPSGTGEHDVAGLGRDDPDGADGGLGEDRTAQRRPTG